MTDDLDRDLRAMLAERARDIDTVPSDLLTRDPGTADEVLDVRWDRHDLFGAGRRYWPVLVAAAAVVAVLVGLLTALDGPSGHGVAPAHHTSASPRPKPIPTLQRTTCRIADPARWNATVRASGVELSGVDFAQGGVDAQAALPNGDLVVTYGRADDPSGMLGSDLGVLSPGSSRPRDLGFFGIPSHASDVFSLAVDLDNTTRTAVVSIDVGVSNHSQSVTAIYAVDLDTGHRTRLMSATAYPSKSNISQGYVLDGTAYWEVDPLQRGRTITVYAVPVSGGTPRIVAQGSDLYLDKSALGIDWHDNGPVDRPAQVPAVVARQGEQDVFDTFESFVTDGTSYAWVTEAGALDWYSPAAGHIVSFRGLAGHPGQSQFFVNAVAGPLVFVQTRSGTSQEIIDTRSGAFVHITSGGTFVGTKGGVAAGDPMLDGPAPTTSRQFMRLDTSSLAPLSC